MVFDGFILNAAVQTGGENNSWPGSLISLGQLFYLVMVCIIVFVAAYYATRLLANARGFKSKNSNLNLIEVLPVGNQSFLHLVRVGDKYFVIGATKEQLTFLIEVDSSELIIKPESSEKQSNPKISFEKYFTQFLRKNDMLRGEKNENDKEDL